MTGNLKQSLLQWSIDINAVANTSVLLESYNEKDEEQLFI